MATVINAQTSAGGLSITPDLSGQIALQSNGTTVATVGSTTLSIPNGVGGIPAFSAYQTSAQSLTTSVTTKITFDTKEYDTASCFSTANSRFTPTVAGYYQINGNLIVTTGVTTILAYIYKNGSVVAYGSRADAASLSYTSVVSILLYMNGSTDYVEMYGYSSSTIFAAGSRFSGFLVRPA